MIFIFAAELICGLLLRLVLGVCPWNYVNKTLSIGGIITLEYAPVWFVTGIIFEKTHDVLISIQSIMASNPK